MKFYFPSGVHGTTHKCNACGTSLSEQIKEIVTGKHHQCVNCGELHEVQQANMIGMNYIGILFKKDMPSWYEKYPSVEIVE